MAKAKADDKSKKVVILLGSPRKKGNSAALAERIADGAASAGARVETFYLHGMKIAPCSACEACHKPGSKGCVIKDDMQRLYPELKAADAVVFASPIYWFTMSAQLKLALDRCYALVTPEGSYSMSGKRIGLAFSYGGEDPFDSGCTNAIRTFQDAFRFIGAEIVGMVYGSAGAAGELRSNSKVMKEAQDLGRKLAGA
jgi:multimeric flavodoxin WrbA